MFPREVGDAAPQGARHDGGVPPAPVPRGAELWHSDSPRAIDSGDGTNWLVTLVVRRMLTQRAFTASAAPKLSLR